MTGSRTTETSAQEKGSFLKGLTSFFTSVQTTITLLFLLAAASVIGTLMPQELPMGQVQQGSVYERVALILDLHNLYRSWWFILLLILLSLNLLGCLIRRLPSIPGEWRGDQRKSSFNFEFTGKESVTHLKDVMADAFRPILGRTSAETEVPNLVTLVWVKHRFSLLGFPLIHVAIIFILIGGLIGLLYGFRGYIEIPEGNTKREFVLLSSGQTRTLPFSIEVKSFAMTRYPTGEPKEYRSDVNIVKNGKEAATGPILVNHPLTFDGISLYQSDYKIVGIEVRFESVDADGKSSEFTVKSNTPEKLTGTPYELRVLRPDPGATSRGPGVEISLDTPGEMPRVVKLFRKDPEPFRIGGTELRFLDYQPLYATGLQIGYDPGSVFVWLGCSLLIGGFMLTLFTNMRHLKIELEARESDVQIRVAGRSRRMRREFRETVGAVIREHLKS